MRSRHRLLCLTILLGIVHSRWISSRPVGDFRERYEYDPGMYDVNDVDWLIQERNDVDWLDDDENTVTGIKEPGDDDDESPREELLRMLPSNGELFEGDMIMSDRLRDIVLDRGEKRASMANHIRMWPSDETTGTVEMPYTTDQDFQDTHGKLFVKAIERYTKYTCIRLVIRTNQTDYLHFVSPNKSAEICSSSVGKIGGEQVVTLGKQCHVLGTILHEVMHNLGFVHEHTRSDRDTFVKVVWKNIKDGDSGNFRKYAATELRDDKVEYNFNSIMHYRNDAFTKKELLDDKRETLVAEQNEFMQFGQRADFSKGDARSVNSKYCMGTKELKEKYDNEAHYAGLINNTSGDQPAYLTAKRQRLDNILTTLKKDTVAHKIILDLRSDGVTKFKDVLKELKKDGHVKEILAKYLKDSKKAKEE